MAKSKTVEDIMEELSGIVSKLEGNEISLEDSFKYYSEGIKLVRTCNDKIDKIEKKINIVGGEDVENEF